MSRPRGSRRRAVPGIAGATVLLIAATAAAAPMADTDGESRTEERSSVEPEHDSCTDEDAACTATARHARADLAARLAVAPERIEVLLAARVTWRDGSLGCPRPDRLYTQALVPGFLIELRAAGAIYCYHAREHGEPFPCGPPEADEDDAAGDN